MDPQRGAQGRKNIFAHIVPVGPPTPIVGVKSTFWPLNRCPLRNFTTSFAPKIALFGHSMRFNIYGGILIRPKRTESSSPILCPVGVPPAPPVSMLARVARGRTPGPLEATLKQGVGGWDKEHSTIAFSVRLSIPPFMIYLILCPVGVHSGPEFGGVFAVGFSSGVARWLRVMSPWHFLSASGYPHLCHISYCPPKVIFFWGNSR